MKIFIIAGEESGDKLGSAIIDSLREVFDGSISFVGIGGNGMKNRGLESIFPITDLSIMGLYLVASQYLEPNRFQLQHSDLYLQEITILKFYQPF